MTESRYAHLVGTLPYPSEEAAMTRALELLGDHLRTLPDGEVGRKTERHKKGERLGWIQWVVERFEDSPAFELVKEAKYESKLGLWADYDSVVRFKVKVSKKELAEHLEFGFDEYFDESWETFEELRDAQEREGLRFQVGVPGALAISLFALGPLHGMRLRSVFEDRLALECNRIYDKAGDDVVFQIEVPVELGLYLKAPALLRPVMLRLAAGWVTSLIEKLRPGARAGVHLCFGDLNNRPFTKVDAVDPLVRFTNAVVQRWPADHPLDFVHVPLAMANIAPSLDPSFYAGLRKLELPRATRFIGGFVHESLSAEDHDRVLSLLDAVVEGPVDVSSACGLGRRDREAAESIMVETARLAG